MFLSLQLHEQLLHSKNRWTHQFTGDVTWKDSLVGKVPCLRKPSAYILVPWFLALLCIHSLFFRTSCNGNAFVAHQSMQNAVSVRPLCPVVLQLGMTRSIWSRLTCRKCCQQQNATKSSCFMKTDNGCFCVFISFVDCTLVSNLKEDHTLA